MVKKWMITIPKLTGDKERRAYIYLPASLINIVLNFLMIPIWGSTGAAVASLVTQICTSILLPFCIRDLRPNAKLMLEAILLRDVFESK